MAEKKLKSLKLHGLDDTYIVNRDPEIIPITLSRSNWVGSEAPYTYKLSDYTNEMVEVVEDVSMTMEQLVVIENAKIKSDPRSNENILYAFGDKPPIDVPVLLIIR